MPYKKKSDYNRFMREYMREYRAVQRDILREARQRGVSTKIRTLAKKKRRK